MLQLNALHSALLHEKQIPADIFYMLVLHGFGLTSVPCPTERSRQDATLAARIHAGK